MTVFLQDLEESREVLSSEIILNHHLDLVRLVRSVRLVRPVKLVRVVRLKTLVGKSQKRFLHHQRFLHLLLILYLEGFRGKVLKVGQHKEVLQKLCLNTHQLLNTPTLLLGRN